MRNEMAVDAALKRRNIASDYRIERECSVTSWNVTATLVFAFCG